MQYLEYEHTARYYGRGDAHALKGRSWSKGFYYAICGKRFCGTDVDKENVDITCEECKLRLGLSSSRIK
jgi:hypothetical protein